MAKFKFIYWLVEFLFSRDSFLFEWDEGNQTKSHCKHGVGTEEIESAFDDSSLLALGEQYQPETSEDRYAILGRSRAANLVFVCFTIREGRIRPISARLANKKERDVYER